MCLDIEYNIYVPEKHVWLLHCEDIHEGEAWQSPPPPYIPIFIYFVLLPHKDENSKLVQAQRICVVAAVDNFAFVYILYIPKCIYL